MNPLLRVLRFHGLIAGFLVGGSSGPFAAAVRQADTPVANPDGRPTARYRLDAMDHGRVLRHGGGPDGCDDLGARDVWVWEHGTYYAVTASPGQVLEEAGEYLMFFSASTDDPIWRTLGIARTKDLDGGWRMDAQPILPPAEQVENSSVYFEPTSRTWWLFTNHVGLRDGLEYTDAIWVYWSTNPNRWNPEHKAVVLDGTNCAWSRHIIGLPSVVPEGGRLALYYDGNAAQPMPAGVKSHMNRDIGLAWLDLPLIPPPTK